jgi:hypothetical protein
MIPPLGDAKILLRNYLKIRIFGRDQDAAEDQPAGILKYVGDLRRGPNADIGRKDFFEMTSARNGGMPSPISIETARNRF